MIDPLPTIPWKNNIGALRLIFAGIVVLAHSYALSQQPALAWLGRYANSEIAVQGFFIVSGFLVVMSFEKSRSFWDYAVKRIRRIYPAYGLVILISACAGALISTVPAAHYFGTEWGSYLVNNLLFLNFRHPDLPGVFQQNPLAAVNGALWTIKLEVAFYMLVPLLVYLLRRRARPIFMALIYLASHAYTYYFAHRALVTGNPHDVEFARQLPGQLCYFMTGTALYYYFDMVRKYQRVLLPLALLLFICAARHPKSCHPPACEFWHSYLRHGFWRVLGQCGAVW